MTLPLVLLAFAVWLCPQNRQERSVHSRADGMRFAISSSLLIWAVMLVGGVLGFHHTEDLTGFLLGISLAVAILTTVILCVLAHFFPKETAAKSRDPAA